MMAERPTSFHDLIESHAAVGKPFVCLDGGMGSYLESLGHPVGSQLWAANLLLDDPHSIAAVHKAYLSAGSNIITTSSYQLSFEGLAARGIRDESEVLKVFQLSSSLARDSVNDFYHQRSMISRLPNCCPKDSLEMFDVGSSLIRPLIAGSIGCYGAHLCNGSEYTGR